MKMTDNQSSIVDRFLIGEIHFHWWYRWKEKRNRRDLEKLHYLPVQKIGETTCKSKIVYIRPNFLWPFNVQGNEMGPSGVTCYQNL